ncbi:VanZ family protein [Teredinibacter haidensis]|uniref:VanZ family protein n=1 Tax=Teredinibacter haidensis TaxID=2731755 RepID=UPI000948F72D|nr:VanZ family protein [Teredinibacter haidensis]
MSVVSTLNRFLSYLFFSPECKLLRRLQFFAAILIFAYMALSASPTQWAHITSDKILHFIGNLLLIGSTWVAFFGAINRRKAIVFAIIYSMTIEALQSFSEMRQPDFFDALTNLSGILVGFGFCLLMERYLNKLKTAPKKS